MLPTSVLSFVGKAIHVLPVLCGVMLFTQAALVAQQPTWNDFPIPNMTTAETDVAPFTYRAAKVPFYPAGESWGTQSEPLQRMQEPLDASQSIKHYVTPEGFRVELFASEPDITKPICMTWDERGRLWIAESVDYPNQQRPRGQGRDRIKVCEDTDGDGRADKFTVFAEDLSIPTSLAPAFGGLVVHQAPDTLFLKDTTGDGKADVRHTLFSGWSTGDTHAGPSNLQYGPDNWYWGMQGYAGFDGVIAGERRKFNRGFYRFRLTSTESGIPEVSEFEFLRSTDNNSWGLGFSEDGLAFGSTANRNPSVFLAIPNRYYERVRGWSTGPLAPIARDHLFQPITEKIRQVDHHGGYTAAAGHALYTARQYPREYWNQTAFVCGPTGHLVGTFVLQREGGRVNSANLFNLLASDDEWAAPISAEVGPDGNVWVIDWYNYIVQHNPTPAGFERGKGNAYKTDLRDKHHGRIYRIVYEKSAPATALTLDGADAQGLVAALRDSNLFWRRHAQRLLVERGASESVASLVKLLDDPSIDEIGLNPAVIHALWTLHGIGALEESDSVTTRAAMQTLAHQSAGVRRTAVAVLPRGPQLAAALLDRGLLEDRNGMVRLATLLALAELPPSPATGRAIATFLSQPKNQDTSLLNAATCAAAGNGLEFLTALAAARSTSPGALRSAGTVAEHLSRGDHREQATQLVGELTGAEPVVIAAVLSGLARGWPQDEPLQINEQTDRRLISLLDSLPTTSYGALGQLASLWGSRMVKSRAAEISDALLQLVSEDGRSMADRIEGANQLIVFQGDEDTAVEGLLDAITPRMAPALTDGIIAALSKSRAPQLPEMLIQRIPRLTPAAQTSVVRVLLVRGRSTEALLNAIETNQLPIGVFSLDQKQALSNHPDPTIAERAVELLASRGQLPDADRQKVLNELKPLLSQQGHPVKGKVVFTEQCSKCHTHAGLGTAVGPDLTGMAVHSKLELLTHLIDPSRSVEGNYRMYTIVTAEGRVLTGLLTAETATTIEVIDTQGKRHGLLRREIDELVVSPKSLMPEGFEKQVSHQQLVDLLAFLTARDKYLPIPLEQAATVTTTRGMFTDESARRERMVFADWSPKRVQDIPFQLVDPRGGRTANAILLNSRLGKVAARMPHSVTLPCNASARAIHLLSGVSGWGYPATSERSVSLFVRLQYEDGETEEHSLLNGVHFADYAGEQNVPRSEQAFQLGSSQLRFLSIEPRRKETISRIELVKGPDQTAPIIFAITIELP